MLLDLKASYKQSIKYDVNLNQQKNTCDEGNVRKYIYRKEKKGKPPKNQNVQYM